MLTIPYCLVGGKVCHKVKRPIRIFPQSPRVLAFSILGNPSQVISYKHIHVRLWKNSHGFFPSDCEFKEFNVVEASPCQSCLVIKCNWSQHCKEHSIGNNVEYSNKHLCWKFPNTEDFKSEVDEEVGIEVKTSHFCMTTLRYCIIGSNAFNFGSWFVKWFVSKIGS